MRDKDLLTYSLIGLILGIGTMWFVEKRKIKKNMQYLIKKGISEETLQQNLASSPEFKHFINARVKAYKKGDKPIVNDRYKDSPDSNGKIKWSRPGHKIDRNEEAKQKGKEKKLAQIDQNNIDNK